MKTFEELEFDIHNSWGMDSYGNPTNDNLLEFAKQYRDAGKKKIEIFYKNADQYTPKTGKRYLREIIIHAVAEYYFNFWRGYEDDITGITVSDNNKFIEKIKLSFPLENLPKEYHKIFKNIDGKEYINLIEMPKSKTFYDQLQFKIIQLMHRMCTKNVILDFEEYKKDIDSIKQIYSAISNGRCTLSYYEIKDRIKYHSQHAKYIKLKSIYRIPEQDGNFCFDSFAINAFKHIALQNKIQSNEEAIEYIYNYVKKHMEKFYHWSCLKEDIVPPFFCQSCYKVIDMTNLYKYHYEEEFKQYWGNSTKYCVECRDFMRKKGSADRVRKYREKQKKG